MDESKWTPERRAAFRRVIETARAFVQCADEFVPEDGSRFYPGALEEDYNALDDALTAEGRAWDEGPDEPVVLPAYEPVEPPTGERVTRRG